MKNWIKLWCGNCLSIIAIGLSIVAICVSLPTTKPLSVDYMGVLIGILSLLVTILVGWQIWSALSIDKKIKEKTEEIHFSLSKAIEKAKEDLSIAGARATAATLYKAENINLNLNLLVGKSELNEIMATLNIMSEYATALKDLETLSHFAKILVDTKPKIDLMELMEEDYGKVCSFFLELSQNILTLLPASDAQVPHLLSLINNLKNKE